jgi:uncharacterized protein
MRFPLARTRRVLSFAAFAALIFSLTCALPLAAAPQQHASYAQEIAAWRTQHTVELTKPDGWLSLNGLAWLEPGDNGFGSAPDNKIKLPAENPAHIGVLHLEGGKVTLQPPPGGFPETFLANGKPAQPLDLSAPPNSDKTAVHLTIGTLNLYVINRENRYALRIKDSHSPALTHFHGLKWYPPNARYRFTAKWIPYSPPKTVTLDTLVGTKYDQPVPGAAEFTFQGKTYRLEPVVEDPSVPKLFFILRDLTSRATTYGACRFLYTGNPSNGLDKPGTLVLDFNKLENPPCAYTPYATCPLPPPGNRLPIALPAGEKRYHE